MPRIGLRSHDFIHQKEAGGDEPMIDANDLTSGDTLLDTKTDTRIGIRSFDPGYNPSIAPVSTVTGKPIKTLSKSIDIDTLNERLRTGRYEPLDVKKLKKINWDKLSIDKGEQVYIRFGKIPEDERSFNFKEGVKEKGVSVYSANVEPVPQEVEAGGKYVPTGSKVQQVFLLMHRDTFLVTGDEVGRGEDGEPLLQNVEILAELKSPGGIGGWVEKS